LVVPPAMLAGAPDPDQRWGVLGDNASPTLLAHAAGLMAGVGTVAVSRQLTLPELTDQVEDSTMVGLIAGPGGAATAVAALEAGLVSTVVLHSGAAVASENPGLLTWEAWLASAPDTTNFPDRPARPAMVTVGTTGRARGTVTRLVLAPVETTGSTRQLRERAVPRRRAHRRGTAAAQRPLTAVRHLLLGRPAYCKFDAATVLGLIDTYRVTSSSWCNALPTAARGRSGGARHHRRQACSSSRTPARPAPDVKRAMIDWFGPSCWSRTAASGHVVPHQLPDWLEHRLRGPRGRAVPRHRGRREGSELGVTRPASSRSGAGGFGPTTTGPEKTAKAYV
jgi:long-chain acyl-CoA synthetase